MTVPRPVIASAEAPRVPLLLQFVIVQPAIAQFFSPFAFTQNVIPVTPPGAYVKLDVTTELFAKAVLLVRLESPGLEIETLNVMLVHPAAGRGITGIRTVSDARYPILVVFVQVTVTPTVAPHDQPLSTKTLDGPDIFAGSVNTTVCTPLDVRLPALVTVIGS